MKYAEFVKGKNLIDKAHQIQMNAIHVKTRKKVEKHRDTIDHILVDTNPSGSQDFDYQTFKKSGLRK